MKLIMFDINRRLASSMKIDALCLVKPLKESLNIEKIDTNWPNYKYFTDIKK